MMKPPCAGPGVRGTLAGLVAVVLLAVTAWTASAEPQPGPTTLTASAEMRPNSIVVVAGLLSDQAGAPVPEATIRVRIDEREAATGLTDGEGRYAIDFLLEQGLRSEPQRLVVVFEGRGGLDASEAEATVGAGQSSAPPPTAPAEAPLAVELEAGTASSTVSAGGLVIIEGTLSTPDGEPVGGARIRVLIDDDESADSLVMTDESGAFQTFAEVPPEHPAGEAVLVVSFAGNNSYEEQQQKIRLVVDRIPLADRASGEPSETTTDVASDSAPLDASPAPPDAEDSPGNEEPGPLSWFYVALVVVGGTALLITVGLVLRGIYGRTSEPVSRRPGSLDLILDRAAVGTSEADVPEHTGGDVFPDEEARTHRGPG